MNTHPTLTKYKIERIRNKVRVKRMYLNHMYYSETLTEEDCETITGWVEKTGLGHRVAYDMWQLKDRESVTMFILKWGQ